MNAKLSRLSTVLLVLTLIFLGGCASTQSPSSRSDAAAENDPFEGVNRAILNFNFKLDDYVVEPAAKGYRAVVPSPVRQGFGNFFSNLWVPNTILNDLLQGKFSYAAQDFSRFFINSTIGVLGIFDVASRLDIPKHREDFGQTLAVWGVESGPYLVLPLLGPSNLRETVGLIPEYAGTDLVTSLDTPERWYATGLRLVNARERLLGTTDVLDLQPDKYLFLREGYRQRRALQIADESAIAADSAEIDEALIDELLEDSD